MNALSANAQRPRLSQRHLGLVPNPHAPDGFTRTDLLTVLGVVAVMLVLVAAGHSRAAASGSVAVCQDNLRRLSLAWYLYASDHSDRLVNNYGIPEVMSTVAAKKYLNWANNLMQWTPDSSVTNTQLTASSRLWPYLNDDYDVFRCPSDTYVSRVQASLGWTGRTRSYSMNDSLGAPDGHPSIGSVADGISQWCPSWRQFLTLSAIPRPSELITFLEEHPDSINDGLFIPGCTGTGAWADIPASFHNGACGFAFVDGHVELHPWAGEATKQPVKYVYSSIVLTGAAHDDYQWVFDRSRVALSEITVRRGPSNTVQIISSRTPTNFVLQATDRLGAGTWTKTTQAAARSVGQNTVQVPMEGNQGFFRFNH